MLAIVQLKLPSLYNLRGKRIGGFLYSRNCQTLVTHRQSRGVTVGAIEDLDWALDQSIAAYLYLFRYTSEVPFRSYQICMASNQRLQMED